MPPLDLNLLGLVLETSPITVNATAEAGNGLLLGNVLTTVLNTVDATTENLTGLSTNLNAAAGQSRRRAECGQPRAAGRHRSRLLPSVCRRCLPTLIAPSPGATTEILDLVISSGTSAGPPVDVDLLGLQITTSNIDAHLSAQTGDGQLLGNLLYNAANLLNPGGFDDAAFAPGSASPIDDIRGPQPHSDNYCRRLQLERHRGCRRLRRLAQVHKCEDNNTE